MACMWFDIEPKHLIPKDLNKKIRTGVNGAEPAKDWRTFYSTPDERNFMKRLKLLISSLIAMIALGTMATASPMTVTSPPFDIPCEISLPCPVPGTLAYALGGSGMLITSATIGAGRDSQFGTYTGYDAGPLTITDGVVISTGFANKTTAADHSPLNLPSEEFDKNNPSEVVEYNAYALAHVTNFQAAYDVATLNVSFNLITASQIGFDFIFGSIEWPDYKNDYTDAFMVFLDLKSTDTEAEMIAKQITFDSSGKPIMVGQTFGSALTTEDENSAFADPHAAMKLTTFTSNTIAAGDHTLSFQIGDVNDAQLDSAVFISRLRAEAGPGGTHSFNATSVPEPASLMLLGIGLAGLAGLRSRKAS
jgi:hypothetical protein